MNKDDLAAKERLAAYIYSALARAHYEELPDNEGIYAEIEGFQGFGPMRLLSTLAAMN